MFQELLDKLDAICTDLGFAAYTTQKGSTINIFLLTMSLMIGTAGLPHVITRFFTVPKVRDARSSAGWALVFIAILYNTAPAVGAMARLNLMKTIQTGPVGAADANIKLDELPAWFTNWSAATKQKLAIVRSTIGRRPVIAAPTATPTKPFSEIGALRMRFGPKPESSPVFS